MPDEGGFWRQFIDMTLSFSEHGTRRLSKRFEWLRHGVASADQETTRPDHRVGAIEIDQSRGHWSRDGSRLHAAVDPDLSIGQRAASRTLSKPGYSAVRGPAGADLRDRCDLDRRGLHPDGRRLTFGPQRRRKTGGQPRDHASTMMRRKRVVPIARWRRRSPLRPAANRPRSASLRQTLSK